MKKAAKTTLTVIIALLLIIVVILVTFSQRIATNPAGTVGNTAGNLNNDGLFCEYDGTVYFYNTFAGGGLFSMDANEGSLHRLNTLEVRNILETISIISIPEPPPSPPVSDMHSE